MQTMTDPVDAPGHAKLLRLHDDQPHNARKLQKQFQFSFKKVT